MNDFKVDGKKFTARSELRELAHFWLVLVINSGDVKVDNFILKILPEATTP